MLFRSQVAGVIRRTAGGSGTVLANTAIDLDTPVRRGRLAPAGLAMGDLGHFIGSRREHTFGQLAQRVLRTLAAEKAVG